MNVFSRYVLSFLVDICGILVDICGILVMIDLGEDELFVMVIW